MSSMCSAQHTPAMLTVPRSEWGLLGMGGRRGKGHASKPAAPTPTVQAYDIFLIKAMTQMTRGRSRKLNFERNTYTQLDHILSLEMISLVGVGWHNSALWVWAAVECAKGHRGQLVLHPTCVATFVRADGREGSAV